MRRTTGVRVAWLLCAAALLCGCGEDTVTVASSGQVLSLDETLGPASWWLMGMGVLFPLGAVDIIRSSLRKRSKGGVVGGVVLIPVLLGILFVKATLATLRVDGAARKVEHFYTTFGVPWSHETILASEIVAVEAGLEVEKRKSSKVTFGYVRVVTRGGERRGVRGAEGFKHEARPVAEDAARRLGVPLRELERSPGGLSTPRAPRHRRGPIATSRRGPTPHGATM